MRGWPVVACVLFVSVRAAGANGPAVEYAARPASTSQRACSSRIPVCVHTRALEDGPAAMAALAAFERTWPTLTQTLGAPAPDPDPDTLAYDVFVAPEPELVETYLEARDVRSNVDRGRAFTRVDPSVRPGCRLDARVATAIARASLFRVAPATDAGSAVAQTHYLAELAVPCATALSSDAVATFQANADAALTDTRLGRRFSQGAATFWNRLEWAFGRQPGGLVTTTWALHPTTTPVGARAWTNEPDTFDVLRASFKGALSTGSTIADLWLDFGVARAFFGSAVHAPELRTHGVDVPLAWDIPWPTKPRRLAPRVPVAPTGASYVLVRHAGASPGARLRVEIDWEEHALFRWAFVKLDADGREMGRVVVPTRERATSAQMTLAALDGIDRVLLVGVNAGDPAYAFDPDDDVFEPHGWLLTIAEE